MTRAHRLFAACFGAFASLAACTSAPSADKPMAEAKPDPRQGEEVRSICFTSQIRNWRANDRDSVIVELRPKEEYKLDLIGTCQPQDAFTTIGLVSHGGGSCLSMGDKLITDARYTDGSCSVRRIYKWNKDANKPAAPAAATSG